MDGLMFIEFTTPPRYGCQAKNQKFSKNPPLATRQKKVIKKQKKACFFCESVVYLPHDKLL